MKPMIDIPEGALADLVLKMAPPKLDNWTVSVLKDKTVEYGIAKERLFHINAKWIGKSTLELDIQFPNGTCCDLMHFHFQSRTPDLSKLAITGAGLEVI